MLVNPIFARFFKLTLRLKEVTGEVVFPHDCPPDQGNHFAEWWVYATFLEKMLLGLIFSSNRHFRQKTWLAGETFFALCLSMTNVGYFS